MRGPFLANIEVSGIQCDFINLNQFKIPSLKEVQTSNLRQTRPELLFFSIFFLQFRALIDFFETISPSFIFAVYLIFPLMFLILNSMLIV